MRCLRNIPPSRIEARHSYSFKTWLPAWLYIFGYARTRMGEYIRLCAADCGEYRQAAGVRLILISLKAALHRWDSFLRFEQSSN